MRTRAACGCAGLMGALLVLGFFSRSAESAGVFLRSDSFEKICKVEVSKGPRSNHTQNPVVFSESVSRGWSYESHDGDYVCYRRSSDPQNCWSALTEYRCLKWPLDGQMNFSLQ